ncbi:PIR protein,putative [Plasmodium sp.]|nr:PIR protein,putative [Plasmodium sp.]
MVYYNFKLIIFSIILGILTLIYNNDSNGLYKNINYKNTVLFTTNFRSLEELLNEPTTNHRNENIQLKEYGLTNERKYTKNIYAKDDTKKKQKIPELREKKNTGTQNSKKYKKEKYNKEKDAKSSRAARSIKYLEMQRKLYNNFYVKPYMDFDNLPDKSNNKSCECQNTKKSSSKVHDKYLENLKDGCVGGAGVCAASYAAAVNSGVFAAVKALPGVAASVAASNALPFETALQTVVTAVKTALEAGGFSISLVPYGIAIYVILAIIVVLIILYIWLYRRRKNSWKHECKKHLCT